MERRVALVTGAGGDIGRATARLFADKGYAVVVADINRDGGQETVDIIAGAGGDAAFFEADIGDEASVRTLIDFSVSTFGGLHAAVNNAGIVPMYVPIHQLPIDSWNENVRVNLTGVFLCMKYQIAHMRAYGGGSIVNISSAAAKKSVPNTHAYSASKRAILALTSCAAVENGRMGIRVNAIMPGYIMGRMAEESERRDPTFTIPFKKAIPTGQFGEPRDIADAVVWLCSDSAKYVTGQTLAVDGGMTI